MRKHFRSTAFIVIAAGLIVSAGAFLWVASLEIPTLEGFEERVVTQSTKIYDRTGEVLLFDLHEDVRRTIVPLSAMSRNVKNATIAIEDASFYEHRGVRPIAFLRALLVNIKTRSFSQGGSTITQQVVKNTLLSNEKTISRKVKEWILALKLEQVLSKDEILEIYLNEAPYGGNMYGAEEAAQHFFGKSSRDLTLPEAAYLAALPQAPTYYSPYGNHPDALEARKNLVLLNMLEKGFISEAEYDSALAEEVAFEQYGDTNIKAPHFVFFIREYLEDKYGEDAVYKEGLKVITTLNYDMQKIAEDVVSSFAYENERDFNAENAGLVALDPKTGHILAMVGSRDYFDEDIDGKFNVTTAHRQPGSTFKPIVYATAFKKGYTPETVVFDVQTQFSVNCPPNNFIMSDLCYSPVNYDDVFRGPMTFRNALAQSINIPAVKVLYLAGIGEALKTAADLGIKSLVGNSRHYGLPLVLGGGEVSLLDLTSAYSVFANDGVRNERTGIMRVEDTKGEMLEEYKEDPQQVLEPEIARMISSILTDVEARVPAYGQNSFYFGAQPVAVKTGTTNDFRDVWIMGYTPNISVGTWAGNNDNTPIVKRVAGYVLAPMWRSFMDQALPLVDFGTFPPPPETPGGLKPVLTGFWQGTSPSTPHIPPSVHSILHWVDKDNPRGPVPGNPQKDGQYVLWEYGVQLWAHGNVPDIPLDGNGVPVVPNIPNGGEVGTIPPSGAYFAIQSPAANSRHQAGTLMTVSVNYDPSLKLEKVDYYVNGAYMGAAQTAPFSLSIVPQNTGVETQTIKAVGSAGYSGTYTDEVTFMLE
ncbi:MAG: PBP1A family penicillin-binding protein [bacterium]|nr:PBP1A family penicillin-binding protein [bacterium]